MTATTEIEPAIIGLLLHEPDHIATVEAAGMTADWFTDPVHRLIFSAITRAGDWGFMAVKRCLVDNDNADAAGRLLGILDAGQLVTGQLAWHVEQMRDAQRRRELESLAMELKDKLHEGDIETIVESIRERLDQIGAGGITADYITAADWLNTEPPPLDAVFDHALDRGDKLALIASSKTRKTMLMMQMSIAVATGTGIAGIMVPKARRVLYVNLEIRGHHFHRRLKRIARSVDADLEVLGRNLFVVNVRDRGNAAITMQEITAIAKRVNAEFIVLDPLYKLHQGDENSAGDMKPLLAAFDAMTRATVAAIAFVHHDPKGSVGDRKQADRGAGSNVIGRDYDAAIFLTPHRSEPEALVMEFVLRNYAPREPVVLRWDDGSFVVADDLEATKETSTGSRGGGAGTKAIEQYADAAFRLVVKSPLPSTMFHEKF